MCRRPTYNVRPVDTLTARPRVRRPVVSLWLLRTILTVHLVAVLAQPVLAGLFLAGDVDAIGVHSVNAVLIELLGLVAMLVSIGYVTAGRGRVWVLPVLVGLFLVEAVQAVVGYTRTLQLHVPLGVVVVVLSLLLAAWIWTPAAARPRGAR
jgi:hypothetical protein